MLYLPQKENETFLRPTESPYFHWEAEGNMHSLLAIGTFSPTTCTTQ